MILPRNSIQKENIIMERLSLEQIEVLKKFDSPTVCNAIECFGARKNTEGYMRPGMLLRTQDKAPVVGYAATAKVSAAHPDPEAYKMLMGYYAHVRETPDPCISVIEDIDHEGVASFWGEVQATVHLALGCVATLIKGGVRDIDEANRLGFHFFATEINVAHGYTHVEKFACPVTILGLTVYPGDLLHMDQHGVVLIPHEIAPKLAPVCREIAEAELPMLEPCRKAIKEGRKPTMEEIATWRESMNAARKACKPE
jgi:regulator of RNase E activity RraA